VGKNKERQSRKEGDRPQISGIKAGTGGDGAGIKKITDPQATTKKTEKKRREKKTEKKERWGRIGDRKGEIN